MPTFVTHDAGIMNVNTIDFDSQNSVTIDADTGGVSIDGTDNSNFSLTANNGSDKTLAIKSVNTGAGSGLIDIESDGNLDINSSGGLINVGNDAVAQNINIGTGAAARTITMGNTTGATGIALNSGTNHTTINTTGDILLQNSGSTTSKVDSNGFTTSKLIINNTGGVSGYDNHVGGWTISSTNDRVLVWDADDSNKIKFAKLDTVCFLEGTKITLPDKKYSNIEDLTLDDKVLTYNIDGLSDIKDKTKISEWSSNDMKGSFSESGIRNIWVNPTDSYLIINNKLRVTNHHLIHFRRNGVYYFNYAGLLEIHDELLTDEEVYEPVELIELKKDTINVYNFELDKDQTYFADNYLVHHYCKLCSGYSNII